MIDPISISPTQVIRAKLTIVDKTVRLRDQIDSKRPYFIAKRVFDVCFSLLFILGILSWLLPIMAILIKLSSRGPVFFLQKRVLLTLFNTLSAQNLPKIKQPAP